MVLVNGSMHRGKPDKQADRWKTRVADYSPLPNRVAILEWSFRRFKTAGHKPLVFKGLSYGPPRIDSRNGIRKASEMHAASLPAQSLKCTQFAPKIATGKICAVSLNCVLVFVCFGVSDPHAQGPSNYTHYWSCEMLRRNLIKWSLAATMAFAGVALSARNSEAHFHRGWGSSGGGWGSSGGYYGWSGS